MNEQKLIISRDTVSNQKIGLLFLIIIVVFLGFFTLIDWNFYYLLIAFLGAMFALPFIIFSSNFYDIIIGDQIFIIRNFFKPPVEIQSTLFDKVTVMDTLFWRPNSPYFTVHFKDGSKFSFARKTTGDIRYALQEKERLAKERTEEIHKFLKDSF